MERKGWPEPDELVVCTVKQVKDFGAFTELDEYGRKEGLIHISEVAAGWVKYIRDHVREGQKIVCKVLNVDADKQHIDLSLKDVNEHQRREKIQEWKNEQKAEKWIKYVAEITKIGPEELEMLIDQLYTIYNSVYEAFEEGARNGPAALVEAGVSDNHASAISKVGKENIKVPSVDITGYIDLTCPGPNGVDIINKALLSASKVQSGADVKVDISYIGAPRYRIHVIAPDYKKAENILKSTSNEAIKLIQEASGTGTFHRHNDTKS